MSETEITAQAVGGKEVELNENFTGIQRNGSKFTATGRSRSMMSGNCAATCENFTGTKRNGSNSTARRSSSRINNLVLSNELIKVNYHRERFTKLTFEH